MSRSLNKSMIIGNITKDPILKTSQAGKTYVLFTVATNRSWKADNGEKHEEAEFHRVIAWEKLGEIIAKFASSGKKIYVEGRMATRKFTDKEDKERTITEIVASDVLFLDKKEKEISEGGETNE